MYRIQITTKNTIGNQLSTEQLYLGYMYDLEETLLHHDVFYTFLHYIDDRDQS